LRRTESHSSKHDTSLTLRPIGKERQADGPLKTEWAPFTKLKLAPVLKDDDDIAFITSILK
jgi:hypothetical protein